MTLPDTLTFSDAAIPEVTRATTAVNPFIDAVKSLVRTDRALTFTVDGPADTNAADGNLALKQALRKLSLAGLENGVTVAKRFEQVGSKSAPQVRITFWTRERIARKAKTAE